MMGLVTANIQPVVPDEVHGVPSALGMQAVAVQTITVIEADGFGRHKQHPEIDCGAWHADLSIVAGCDRADRVRSR
ncbi:hypothetical protein [Bradyrhizobium sp. dw_78]|uniref:hypothetical protein n=1 Tax=Bradyrhizobium sp. dw_78 TaxID=2719793 RepID=UPI001BD3A17A|nr:hypothetical protein [Bradyrhizobium sp. dw_78]